MPSAPRPPPKDVALVQATSPRASNGRLGSIAAVPTRPPEVTTALKSVPEEPVATDQVDASLYDSIEQIGNNTAVVTPVLVTVRVRPPTIGELAKRDGTTLCTETLKSQVRLLAANGKGDGKPKEFTFDRVCRYVEACIGSLRRDQTNPRDTACSSHSQVFGVEDGQKKVYDAAVRKLIDKCLNGYNGCIFACMWMRVAS